MRTEFRKGLWKNGADLTHDSIIHEIFVSFSDPCECEVRSVVLVTIDDCTIMFATRWRLLLVKS
jgi:hypothetical protein